MNALHQRIIRWPQMPTLPRPGEPVLIRVSTGAPRRQARQASRVVLRQVVSIWSGRAPEAVPLHETSRGPEWHGELAGHSLGISLSYSEAEAWIGLLLGGVIGVDAVRPMRFAEMEMVGRVYLGPSAWQQIHGARDPARAFALAWTGMEARMKCLKQPLTEWRANEGHPSSKGLRAWRCLDGHYVVTVVTGPSHPVTVHTPPVAGFADGRRDSHV
jgi:hypothetical protein